MSEDAESPSRPFEPVETVAEAEAFLREGAAGSASAMIWTKNQEHMISAHLRKYDTEHHLLHFRGPKGFDPRKFIEDLARLAKEGAGECFFSLSLQRANIFFKTRFMGADAEDMKFLIPAQLYKVQRRKDLRFRLPDHLHLSVAFVDPRNPEADLTFKILDISASGLSFVCKTDEGALFAEGALLKGLYLNIQGRKIACEGEVRQARAMKEPRYRGATKVGVLLKGIRPGDSQHIAGFVFEENRKYLSRIL